MKRWRPRILWIFAALVVACCIYLWSLSPQVAAVQLSRKIARQSPYVHMVPLALPDSSVATAAGTRLTYCGYVFEVPWNDLDEAKTTSPDRVVLHFRSGRTLILHSLPPREFVNGIGNELTDMVRLTYGEKPLESDYDLQRLILESTPGKVSLFSSRKEAVGAPMLLTLKAVSAPEQSGLFSIQTKTFKGFQWGDPQKRPWKVIANLYAGDGSLEFIFARSKATELPSQSEINRVLQSATKSTQVHSASMLNPRPLPPII